MHLQPSNPLVRSSPTTLEAAPTTLQGVPTTFTSPCQELAYHPRSRTYDPQIPLSGGHLRPLKPHLRPFKGAPTTLKSPCQELTYDPRSRAYDPPRLHLRPSNPLVRSSPTTLEAAPTTLQGRTYDPQIPLSGAHDDPFRTLAALQSY